VADPRTVVVFEDQADIAALVSRACTLMGLRVEVFSGVAEFKTASDIPDNGIVLLDLGLRDSNGVEILRILAERQCTAPILIMSGEDEGMLCIVQRLGQSYGLNVLGILQKPFTIADLQAKLGASLSGRAVGPYDE
jgi:DNA-binding response OmpR family regulator